MIQVHYAFTREDKVQYYDVIEKKIKTRTEENTYIASEMAENTQSIFRKLTSKLRINLISWFHVYPLGHFNK